MTGSVAAAPRSVDVDGAELFEIWEGLTATSAAIADATTTSSSA
jgi:hypothetical protein